MAGDGFRSLRFSLFFLALALSLQGQWLTQTISLRPGWNAVALRVQPEPNACETVFAGLPVKSVWAWNRRFEPVRYVQDAAELSPHDEDWLCYFPAASTHAPASTLHAVHGGRAYLVEIGGNEPASWRIQGVPVTASLTWVPDSFNLVGLPIDPEHLASLESFFASSGAHALGRFHRLNGHGRWETLRPLAGTTPGVSEAIWAYCSSPSTFQGPVSLVLERSDGLHFGQDLATSTLRIRNHSCGDRAVRLRLRTAEAPLSESAPYLAGPVALSRYRIDEGHIGWQPMEEPVGVVVAAGQERAIRLGVRRADMLPFVPPAGATARSGVIYASLLDISDGEGTQYTVPVTSEGLVGYRKMGGQLKAVDPRVGLWVGHVSIDYVSSPAQGTADPVPPAGADYTPNIPASSEFEFRLIVHVDSALQARLVQQVTLMYDPGTYGPDPVNAGRRVVAEPGRHVLITDDALLSRYSGSAVRADEPVGRRISTVAYAFAWDDPGTSRPAAWAFSGGFPGDGMSFPTQLRCVFTMPGDDPLNPFKHRYHPDHDNLDERFEATVEEAFPITRSMTLTFTDTDPERPDTPPQWLDSEIGGYYSEVIEGVHHAAIAVKGRFRLERVSPVSTLNDTGE